MKEKSIWLDKIVKKSYPKLTDNIDCDIVIVGGGLTGLSCGYFLQNSNKKIIILERNKICTGTTAKSTGKITYLQDNILNKINNIYNQHTAINYLKSQKYAISLIKNIVVENNIKCNFSSVNSYIFNNSIFNNKIIKQNYSLLKNFNIKLKKNVPISIKCYKALEANDTYVFHPVKFCISLAKIINKKIQIYENTNVSSIKPNDNHYFVTANNKIIKTKQVILACHYPFFLYPYFFPLKTFLQKSFLVASVVEETKPISLINIDKKVVSLRYHKDKNNFLIYVGETNSLSSNIDNDTKKHNIVWDVQKKFSPYIKYCWSNYDIMTFDYLPFIGEIKHNLFVATGYNTWGMTNGVLAGKIISNIILDKDNEYSKLFNPNRNIKNIPNLVRFNFKNSFSFFTSKLKKNKSFYDNNVKIINENGKQYGVYIDENKKEHKVFNMCPHMKCNLSFNYQTKTWDCPCHGSSFDIDGNIIYGPTNKNIKSCK